MIVAEPENKLEDDSGDSGIAHSNAFNQWGSHDNWALVLRAQAIKMRDGLERMGVLEPRQERHNEMIERLKETGFQAEPATSWEFVCNEIDLILLTIRFPPSEQTSSNAELSKKVRATIGILEKVKKSLFELNHDIDFSVADTLLNGGGRGTDGFSDIEKLIRWMEKMDTYFLENRQPPRWKQKDMRNYRVDLARMLISLFECEFNEEAKPGGGSHFRPLSETNNWTKFFQACIYFRTGEIETPDRQAVLWEAYRNRWW